MIALAAGPTWAIAATACYTVGIVINPHLPSDRVLQASTPIRLVAFTTMGALVGWFAHSNRALSDRLRVAEERDFLTGLLKRARSTRRSRRGRGSEGPSA